MPVKQAETHVIEAKNYPLHTTFYTIWCNEFILITLFLTFCVLYQEFVIVTFARKR